MSNDFIANALAQRFADPPPVPAALAGNPGLGQMAARGSCRRFRPEPPDPALLRALAAIALGAPSKSDLQQRDIVMVEDPALLERIKALLAAQDWIAGAPSLLVFCANNRRQRQLHDWAGRPFANDHLDAFFNASVDAGIALSSFIHAAEAAGLGCCPISTIRNVAPEVCGLLALPAHVFPVAGLAVGHPLHARPRISMRLPLAVTLHTDRFAEEGLRAAITDYDTERAARMQVSQTWSDGKIGQYERPQREDFGAFIRGRGFGLD